MFKRTLTVALALLLLTSGAAFAQFLDPSLRWQTIETPHFRVTFHDGTAGMAQLTAQAAEEAYAWWQEKLGYGPADKVEVVIVDFQDGPNGFANLIPNNEFVNFTAYAGFAGGFANSESPSWEKLVSFHEYGHIADLDFVAGLSRTLRRVLGRIVLPGMGEPTLLVEGIPTYGEFLHRGASRANEPRVAMVLRAMLLEGQFPTYQRASFYYSRDAWPLPGSISHDVGPWFLRYLEDTYGQDTYRRLKEAMATDPWWVFGSFVTPLIGVGLNGDFNQIFRRVVGRGLDELWVEFQHWLNDQFAEQIQRIEDQGLTTSRRVTTLGFFSGGPVWSPDGQWIYYSHGGSERVGGLRRVHPDGTGDQAVISGGGGVQVSPDGKTLYYIKGGVYRKFYFRNDLYRYDLASGKETRLTWGERPLQVALTPEGDALIYARYNWGEATPSLRRLELDGGKLTTIQEFPADTAIENLALSPDGATLALSIWRRGGYQDLYTLPAGGGELVALTQDKATDYQPRWSPDGQYVLFSSDRGGVYNLFAYRLADGTLHQVSNVLTGALAPSASPDGTQIAFTGYSAQGYDVHLMTADPERWTPVDFALDSLPAWEGFPQGSYEVKPYDPLPSLLPKLWFPVLGDHQIGAGTFGVDALFAQGYSLSGGWDWRAGEPFFNLSYSYSGMLPVTSFNLGFSPQGYFAGGNASYPLVVSNALSQLVSVGYQRRDFGKLSQTVSGNWSLSAFRGLDLFADRFNLSVSGTLNQLEGQGTVRKVVTDWRESLSLPVEGHHALQLRFAGGWSDASESERGFSLGGTDGTFSLRGFERGTQAGRLASVAGVEYDFPLFSIERGISLWPVFFDDLSGAAFVEAGTAGETLSLSEVKLGFGAELQLSLNVSYFGGPTFALGLAQGLGEAGPRFYFEARY